MLRAGAGAHYGLRWGALGLAGLIAATAASSDAEARRRRSSYQPPTASIVVDVNSGQVLQASNADSPRHPASLTKIMTLYLLFEQLETGKFKLSSKLEASDHASTQAPSKLGLKPGETIDVENAIKSIVTKSANDVAVIIAEAIGGSEPAFARMMTAKARELGMTHTSYYNASGLPDDRQITTARDQALLGRAIQDRFPKYYHYFSTRYFTYDGKRMRNHNHLLGRIDGVDGIKTGYIRDSGFNIVTSVTRGKRRIVTVVFGGRSGRERDGRASALIAKYIDDAASHRSAPLVVEGWKARIAGPPPMPMTDPRDDITSKVEVKVASAGDAQVVAAVPQPKAETADVPEPGSTAPIRPRPVKTVTVEPASMQVAARSPRTPNNRTLMPVTSTDRFAEVTNVATFKRNQPAAPAKPSDSSTTTASATTDNNSVPMSAVKPRGGYMIQVGAFDDVKEAKQRLVKAQSKAKTQLGKADPYTERISKGEKALYRARFAGLERNEAEAACKHLKRSDIPCLLLKN
jgi:D-alanyl-D-alanine carboxypeptidase